MRPRRVVPFLLVAGALLFGASAAAEPAAEVITGVVDGSESTRANVPFDNDVASACPAAKPYPGNLAQAGTHYDAYSRTNPGGAQCLDVSLQLAAGGSTDCALNPAAKCGFSEVYSSLDPANAGSGYIGDIGSPVAPGQTRSYSVLIPASAPYVVVVDEYYPGVGTTNYTLTLNLTNPPTAVALQSLSARRTRAGVLVSWSTGSAAGTVAFDVFRLSGASRTRVGTRTVPAASMLQASSYSLVDRRAPRKGRLRYEIDAVSLGGNRTLLGVTTLG